MDPTAALVIYFCIFLLVAWGLALLIRRAMR
jgi:hypothetical protein